MASKRVLSILWVFALATNSVRAEAPAIDFNRDIRPILSNHCFKCHGPGSQKGGVRLDLRESALKRKTVVPEKPELSRLIQRVVSEDDDDRMPPADSGERLKKADVEKLRAWIEQGAPYAPHWAYVTPRETTPPRVASTDWAINGIDHFVLARLERAGLKPSPQADRSTLVRRVYLDLLGLLPDDKETAAFLADERPDAYDRLVQKLLDSPHYGERQARHWLDLARYADSNGYTIDKPRSIWPYRDWVVSAFNRDLPFDQFTIEQLAGDLLDKPTREQLVATGFQRNTPFNEEGGTDPEQFRVERTIDRTNTLGSVWLGLTVACAQCHDHKYDAVKQKEYYQLYAFFNDADESTLRLTTPDQERQLADLLAKVQDAKKAETEAKDALARRLKDIEPEWKSEAKAGWETFDPVKVAATEGTKLARLDDKSVLASGKSLDTDVYVVEGQAHRDQTLTAIRLEALTHRSLPNKGPGRATNGNFVLSNFVVEIDGKAVTFSKAIADHSQENYPADDALKGDPKKGWAINVANGTLNVNRHAVFVVEKPLEVKKGQAVKVSLHFSEWPKKYTLGRFRLATTEASAKYLTLPVAAQSALFLPPAKRSAEQMDALSTSLLEETSSIAKVVQATKDAEKARKDYEAKLTSTLTTVRPAKPRVTKLFQRGDFLSLGDPVEANVLAVLPPLGVDGRPANRLDLARWLVRAEHPLTSRVVVNRAWQQFFGVGLVETENDFGMQGAMPTHPELLDWLAVQFASQRKWSTKELHRLIVTSATYRQASIHRDDLAKVDPDNRLLGRQNRIRVEAEIIRDAALSASGLLTRKLGGPGVYPPQPAEVFQFTQNKHPWPESKGEDRYRRGLYTFVQRQAQHPLLTTFDGSDAQTACTRRNRSNTPLQALHLANDPVFVELAEGLGKRLLREAPKDDAGRIDLAFRLCFSREPSDKERERLTKFLAARRERGDEASLAQLARVLFNLDEFITRE